MSPVNIDRATTYLPVSAVNLVGRILDDSTVLKKEKGTNRIREEEKKPFGSVAQVIFLINFKTALYSTRASKTLSGRRLVQSCRTQQA